MALAVDRALCSQSSPGRSSPFLIFSCKVGFWPPSRSPFLGEYLASRWPAYNVKDTRSFGHEELRRVTRQVSPSTIPKSGGTKVRTGPALEVTESLCSGPQSGVKVCSSGHCGHPWAESPCHSTAAMSHFGKKEKKKAATNKPRG